MRSPCIELAYEIQENKVIPVLLYGTHNNFYELAENHSTLFV